MQLTDSSLCHTRLADTTGILNDLGLANACLVFDPKGTRERHAISWTQVDRKLLGCVENYWLLDYHLPGDKKFPFKVFVADNFFDNGNPPSQIDIAHGGGRLYMAYFPIDFQQPEGDHAIIFVYQPSASEDCRRIYQKRFHMGLNTLVEAAATAGGGVAGGAAAGALLGSIIPGPGTALGLAVGATGSFLGGVVSRFFTNNCTGHFLRFVS